MGDLWTDLKKATWGKAVTFMASGAEDFAKANHLPEVNSVAHAYVSAQLVYYQGTYIWDVDGAVQDATILGYAKEWEYYLLGSNPKDTFKDQWNNDVGRKIAAFAVEKGWPWSKVEAMLVDAYRDGWIAKNGDDPRLFGMADPRCFPADTPIATSLTSTTCISALRVGDTVLAFDPHTDHGRGELVPRRITKLFSNITTEWVKLSWVEAGVERELVATPGHHFLDQFGNFPPIAEMIRDGGATVVLASGELAEVSAESIVYSAATAHLFEKAQSHIAIFGNTTLKPQMLEGWQTYNFEAEDLHTYVAGGVRVHNVSLFTPDANTWGSLADNISGQISNHIWGANSAGAALYGSALSAVTSTAADANQGRADFNAAHLGGRYMYEVAGSLGAFGGAMLAQDLISGLGIRGNAAAALSQFGVATNDNSWSLVCAA